MKPEVSRLPADLVLALLDAGMMLDKIIAGALWREHWEGNHIEATFLVNGLEESLDRLLDPILDHE